jgi:acetolactate synthase-1/3 small subunit
MIVALMEDRPGVLSHVSNLFRRRNFNIESLTVGHSETPGISRMTVVVRADDDRLEQIMKQLYKLINVTKVSDLRDEDAVIRELALIKVHATSANRGEIKQLVDIFHAEILDVAHDSMTIEMTGSVQRLESFVDMLRPFGIKEMTRTGRMAMIRGSLTSNGT